MGEQIVKAMYGSPQRPLKVGSIEIECYVLENEQRVLVQGEMIGAVGMSRGGSGSSGGDRLAKFVAGKLISPYVASALRERTANPIKFRTPRGNLAYGYEATILADLCDAVLEARKAGVLQKQQQHIAHQCEILMRGFARVGIIALIDEATGYQEIRARRALAEILEKYIAKEYREWTKTFPNEFYEEMFRLKGWPFDPSTIKRPSVIGKYTNDVVYERLAPGILTEIRKLNPITEKGYRRRRHHQWLTGDIGHPALKDHLTGVLALMRASANWSQFHRNLQRSYPKLNEQIPLALGD